MWATPAFCLDRVDSGLCGPLQRSALTGWDSHSAVQLPLFHRKPCTAHRVLLTVRALSAHPDVKGQETKKVASDWAETTSGISTGLSGLTVESWAQCEKFPISGAGDGRRYS